MKLTWFTEHYQLNLQLESLHVEINQMVLPLRKPSTVYDIQIHQINLLQNLSKWGSSLVDFKLDKLQTNVFIYNLSGIYPLVKTPKIKNITGCAPRTITLK